MFVKGPSLSQKKKKTPSKCNLKMKKRNSKLENESAKFKKTISTTTIVQRQ